MSIISTRENIVLQLSINKKNIPLKQRRCRFDGGGKHKDK